MSKRVVILFLLFALWGAVSAQKKLNYIEVDKQSYELYSLQKWNELIEYAGEVRAQGIDFFYLQVRTGIAYYNLKKYRSSSEWFLKAWENDQSFDWLQEYVYYSLVFAGRATEASKLAVKFTPQIQQKIKYSKSKLTRLALEGGYCINPDFDQLKDRDLAGEANVGSDYGASYLLNKYHFESFDMNHQVAPGFSLNHNLTYINVDREEQVDWGSRSSFPIKTNQFQYFINPHFLLGKKLYVSPSFNLVWGNSSYYSGSLNSDYSRLYTEQDYNYTDFIFTTSAWTHFGNFSPGAEVNVATISDEYFTQLSAWVTFYPFSNANLYFTPRIYFKADNGENPTYNALGMSGGAQIGRIHFYGRYLQGEMENFVESAGYVIANFPGKSDQKISGSIFVPIGKSKKLIFRYINQNIMEYYNVYSAGIYSNSTEYKYVRHTLTLGLSWTF